MQQEWLAIWPTFVRALITAALSRSLFHSMGPGCWTMNSAILVLSSNTQNAIHDH